MLILNKFYLAGFICCISVLSFAQKGSEIEEDKFRAIHWTVNEGLAHDQVSCMLKDAFGFLWIGTPNGLSRFDGSTFKNSYWDLDTTGITDPSQGAGQPPNDPGITGLTDAQLKAGLPAGFDPKIWGSSARVNDGYPYLLANPPT